MGKLSKIIVAAAMLAIPAGAIAGDGWVCPTIGHPCHYEKPLSDEQVLALVATATMVQRAAKMCPQYNYDEAIFDPTIAKARALVGDMAVDQRIENSNMIVEELLARGLKSRFCDLEKAKVEEIESEVRDERNPK